MLLHRLILLVMFVVHSISELTTNCDRMVCLAPEKCFFADKASSRMLYRFDTATNIFDKSCEAIVKIRSYTTKHILIVLESYETGVKSVKLEQGPNSVFECINDGVKVEAKYNNEKQTMLTESASPLSCEFYVKTQNDDVFLTADAGFVKLFSSKSTTEFFKFQQLLFKQASTPTCDPEKIIDGSESNGMHVLKVDRKLNKLVCPGNYTLMFQEIGKEYLKASSIICQLDAQGIRYDYYSISDSSAETVISGSFTAQCQRKICTMCDDSVTLSPLAFELGDCNTLKCPNGRIKIDGIETEKEKAKCELKEDKKSAAWKVEGTFLDASKKIECVVEKSCTNEAAENFCKNVPGCFVDRKSLLPSCIGKPFIWEGSNVTIICDKSNGELWINNGFGQFGITGKTITCGDPPTTPPPSPPVSAKLDVIIGCTLGGLVLIGLIAGIIFFILYCKKKRSRQQPPIVPNTSRVEMTTAKEKDEPKESKSKESKSANSSKNIEQTEGEKKEAELNKIVNKYRDWKVPAVDESHDEKYRLRMGEDSTAEIHGATGRMDQTIHQSELYKVKKPKKAEESVRRRDKKGKKNKKNEKDDSGPVDVEINDEESKKKKRNSEKKEKKNDSDGPEKTQASPADPPDATGFGFDMTVIPGV